MSTRGKIQLALFTFLGFLFLAIGIFQWYDLNQIEQGLKEGELPLILHTVYNMAGKWGVALVYLPFAIYSFWRAYSIFSIAREDELENNNEIQDNE